MASDAAPARRLQRIMGQAGTAAGVLLLLALGVLVWALFWPIPEGVVLDSAPLARGMSDSSQLDVSDLRSVVVTGTPGGKGVDVLLTFMVTTQRDTRFYPALVSLQMDPVVLPSRQGTDTATSVVTLERGRSIPIELLFSVPRGSMDATLVVQTSTGSLANALRIPLRLDTGEDL
jgi:hypothetical protein